MALTASWTTGAITQPWRPRPEATVAWMIHGSREILRVEIPDLDLERTEVHLAIITAGMVPEPAEWRAAVYTGGTAMLLHTASDPAGTYAVWVRIRSGIETVLRIAATLAVLGGPESSGIAPLSPDAGRMPARIPAYLGDPSGRTVEEGGAGMPALIPSRLGDGQPVLPESDTGPDPDTGSSVGMPARMPARIGEGHTIPGAGTGDGPGAMPAAMPASLT